MLAGGDTVYDMFCIRAHRRTFGLIAGLLVLEVLSYAPLDKTGQNRTILRNFIFVLFLRFSLLALTIQLNP